MQGRATRALVSHLTYIDLPEQHNALKCVLCAHLVTPFHRSASSNDVLVAILLLLLLLHHHHHHHHLLLLLLLLRLWPGSPRYIYSYPPPGVFCRPPQHVRSVYDLYVHCGPGRSGKMRYNYYLKSPSFSGEKVGEMTTNRYLAPGEFHYLRSGGEIGFFTNKLTVLRLLY